MEFLRGSIYRLVAIVLIFSLCFPAPMALAQQATEQAAEQASQQAPNHALDQAAHRPGYRSSQLQGNDRVIHALNRFTFGPRPGEVEAVQAMGLEKWFDQQLQPSSIDETDLNTRLAQFPAMQWSTQDLLFRLPSNAMIRQAADGKVQIPPNGTLHAVYENQIYRFQARKAAQAEKKDTTTVNPGQAATSATEKPGMQAGGGANSSMDGSAGMTPAAPNAAHGAAGLGVAGQSAAGQAEAMNTMAPAAADRAPVDEALIAQTLNLAPEQRVLRLQEMQPAEFENFIKSLRPVQRQALTAGMTPDLKESVADLETPEQTVVQELFAERLTRDIYSNAQLQEVMTDFWLNHFNVYLRKNEQMPYYLVSYERDVIRPHALGKFEDLLEAVAHSPAMLIYLDNAQSVGPDSLGAERAKMAMARRPNAKQQPPEGLNENYASRADGVAHAGRERRIHAGGRDPGGARADGLDGGSATDGRRVPVQPQPPRAGHEEGDGRKDQGRRRDGGPRAAAHAGHAAGDGAVHLAQAGDSVCERRSAAGAGGPHGQSVPGERRRHSHGAEDAVPLAGVLDCERLSRQGEDAD